MLSSALINSKIGESECRWKLHRCVFFDDIAELNRMLLDSGQVNVDEQDSYGNTALHLAVVLGRADCVKELLAKKANVHVQNNNGWTPLDEAISRKNAPMAYSLWTSWRAIQQTEIEDRVLRALLSSLPDFDIRFYGELHSWVPFVSRFLPSDHCRLRKKGSKLRLDTTLTGFDHWSWTRGSASYLIDASLPVDMKAIYVDHDKKMFSPLTLQLSEVNGAQFELEWGLVLNAPIASRRVLLKDVSCTPLLRTRSRWDSCREQLGKYSTRPFTLSNIIVSSKVRYEHVPESRKNLLAHFIDLIRTPAALPYNPESSSETASVDQELDSPPPVAEYPVSEQLWATYCKKLLGAKELNFGHLIDVRTRSTNMQFSISMADDIYFPLPNLLNLLNLLVPDIELSDIRERCLSILPPGFPIRIETQVFPTVSGKLLFTDIAYTAPPEVCLHSLKWATCDTCSASPAMKLSDLDMPNSIFEVPVDYVISDIL